MEEGKDFLLYAFPTINSSGPSVAFLNRSEQRGKDEKKQQNMR